MKPNTRTFIVPRKVSKCTAYLCGQIAKNRRPFMYLALMDLQAIPRPNPQSDLTFLLLMMAAFGVFVANYIDRQRLIQFLNITQFGLYNSLYSKGKAPMLNWFNSSLFLTKIITFSILAFEVLNVLLDQVLNLPVFISILILLFVAILAKILLEQVLATTLNLEAGIFQYQFIKLTYRNWIGVFLMPWILILYYGPWPQLQVLQIILFLFISINLIFFVYLIYRTRRIWLPQSFYFILYLCAFEIAPYLIIWKIGSSNGLIL